MIAISNGHNGQFFTPEPLCDMMAIMSVDETQNLIKLFVTAHLAVEECYLFNLLI